MDKTLLFVAILLLVFGTCGGIIVWRLRNFAAMRQDAEERAAVAFEEMQRTLKELRAREAEKTASRPS